MCGLTGEVQGDRRWGGVILGAIALACAAPLLAQDTLPPQLGGRVHSLGLPEIYKPYLGLGTGITLRTSRVPQWQARVGVFRDLGNPILELGGVSLELYAGTSGKRLDGGVRGLFLSNLFRVGAGVDLAARELQPDVLLTFVSPVRRGGVIGGGSDLRLEWLPARRSTVQLAVTIPFRQPHRGATRPSRDHVVLSPAAPRALGFVARDTVLLAAVAEFRRAAKWVNRFALPDLGTLDRRAVISTPERLRPLLHHAATLAARYPGEPAALIEIRAYHRALERAFALALASGGSLADGATAQGEWVATNARRILLDRVLFPYNRLLGQFKREDTTREFGEHARGVLARWLVLESLLPPEQVDPVLYVFQELLNVIEEIRATNREAWHDARLVWLPLQLALQPGEYDGQEELDSLISQAAGPRITHGNRIWYVHNQRFLQEVVRSIRLAQEYHILWVHDIRGLNDAGTPDRLSLLQVAMAYLGALRDGVRAYDRTGHLPVFMIFLDQHYFEQNRSRVLLRLLEAPLTRTLSLPAAFDSLARAVAAAQDSLRQAVQESVLLSAERAHYGEAWLSQLVKVHVSITNPADPSFRSRQILPLLGFPDDLMRDHSKSVLYDVSEQDPYRGLAMYAGMGVGEHYVGPAWEDRALMLQGPVALRLRDEARALLETQGLGGGRMPHVLRPRLRPANYDQRIRNEIDSMDAWGGVASRAVALHNLTGFAAKEITVAKATLFNLLSPGGVLKVPDSIWLNRLLASLLTGSALRGARVIVIAPSDRTAPARGISLVLVHDLLARLIAARTALSTELIRSRGQVQVGIYDPATSVDALANRVEALRQSLGETPFLRELYGFTPSVAAVLDSARQLLGPLPAAPDGAAVAPRLHFKGYLYVSGEAWARLVQGEPMVVGLREYLTQRGRQLREGPAIGEDVMADAMQHVGAGSINPILEQLPPGERGRWVFYLQVGSPNNDYRSMVMDGEGAILVSGWTGLYAVPDFILLTGLCVWPEDEAALSRLLPPGSGISALLARLAAMAL